MLTPQDCGVGVDRSMIEIVHGDVVEEDVDSVVNAANAELLQGVGVCGAIYAAAGAEQLRSACEILRPCPTGQAVLTPGFKLRAKYIIHAVGPIWHGGSLNEALLLKSAYEACFDLVERHALHSIAFPAISTGLYGYPLRNATEIALETANKRAGDILVRFVCIDELTYQTYLELAR